MNVDLAQALAAREADIAALREELEETNKGVRIRTVIDYVREQFRQDEREWFSPSSNRGAA